MATVYMNLSLPVVTQTIGPEWASMLNTALEAIDGHNHTDGKGLAITPAGLNINDDLPMNSNDLTEVRSVRLDNQGSELAAVDDIRCVYVSGGDLYYNNGAGTAIQITSGAGLNAASIGGIGGDFATSSAAVTYSNTNKTFQFTQSSGINANLDVANVAIREAVSSANAVTLKSPASLGASYNWLFPTALPSTGQTKILTIDSSGQVANQYDVDSSTLEVSSNTLRVKDSGVTTAKLEDNSVTTDKIANNNVTIAKSAARTVTTDGTNPGTGGLVFSSPLVSQTISSTTDTDATNLSVTITTTGKPVFIGLTSSGTGSARVWFFNPDPSEVAVGVFKIFRDSTGIYSADALLRADRDTIGSTSRGAGPIAGAIWAIDTPVAGTYTYKLTGAVAGANDFIQFKDLKLVAYEMF